MIEKSILLCTRYHMVMLYVTLLLLSFRNKTLRKNTHRLLLGFIDCLLLVLCGRLWAY